MGTWGIHECDCSNPISKSFSSGLFSHTSNSSSISIPRSIPISIPLSNSCLIVWIGFLFPLAHPHPKSPPDKITKVIFPVPLQL